MGLKYNEIYIYNLLFRDLHVDGARFPNFIAENYFQFFMLL